MTVRNNSQSATLAGDSGFAKIHALAATLQNLHRQKAASLALIVQNLIHTRSRDEKEIEHTLDHLLDCACIPEGLALFKSLCRYYYGIHPASTASYVQAYREMWDNEEAQEAHSGRESITRPAGAGPANPQKARATIRAYRTVQFKRRPNP